MLIVLELKIIKIIIKLTNNNVIIFLESPGYLLSYIKIYILYMLAEMTYKLFCSILLNNSNYSLKTNKYNLIF